MAFGRVLRCDHCGTRVEEDANAELRTLFIRVGQPNVVTLDLCKTCCDVLVDQFRGAKARSEQGKVK